MTNLGMSRIFVVLEPSMTFQRGSEALSRCLTYARSPGADDYAAARTVVAKDKIVELSLQYGKLSAACP
jgi:hypothetical protein